MNYENYTGQTIRINDKTYSCEGNISCTPSCYISRSGIVCNYFVIGELPEPRPNIMIIVSPEVYSTVDIQNRPDVITYAWSIPGIMPLPGIPLPRLPISYKLHQPGSLEENMLSPIRKDIEPDMM